MSVKKPYILKYVKRKTKADLQIFFFFWWYLDGRNYVLNFEKHKLDFIKEHFGKNYRSHQ